MNFVERSSYVPTDATANAIQEVLSKFHNPGTGRDSLLEAANAPEIQEAEKQWAAEIHQSEVPVKQCDVLVAPVGFREFPVILTALMLRPSLIYLLHSAESEANADRVRSDAAVTALVQDPTYHIQKRLITLDDAPANYDLLRQIVTKHPDQQVIVDVTGGVKVMGVSLAAAAFLLRLPVVYLQGKEVAGVIEPFSEKLVLLRNPHDYFGDIELRAIKQHFDNADYDAALGVCRSLLDTVGDAATLGRLLLLASVIELYRDWDAFAHSEWVDSDRRRLAERMRKLIERLERSDYWPIARKDIVANQQFLSQVEEAWCKESLNIAEPYRLVDIYCAAERRAQAGKFDDAVARLYRCLEMSATICLRDAWEIDPSKPTYAKLAEVPGGMTELENAFRDLVSYNLPPKRLGLNDQMALLEIGKTHVPLTSVFRQKIAGSQGQETTLLEWRNRSTLAHGTVPVQQPVYEKFARHTSEIIRWVLPKGQFNRMLRSARHPQLIIERL